MPNNGRPRIGITTSPRRGAEYYVPYQRAVEAVGAQPVELPPGTASLPPVDGLLQTARGDDGTVEAVETSDGLIVAVQCHPEELACDLPWARRLFERFVERARRSQTLRS